MVELERVGLRYGTARRGTAVLRDLSFSVPEGGFRWLLGPSGAGKTSLLRLLHLAVRPTHGQLTLLGQRHRRDRPRRACRCCGGGSAWSSRIFACCRTSTAFDNVALPLRLAGRPEGTNPRRRHVELLELGRPRPKNGCSPARPNLSGGEQQRVAIARAIVARPALLLADEPTGNLDDVQAERLMQLFQEMNRLGATVIVATHNDALVARHPARILQLHEGQLVRDD